jgi:hypothetical protein
MSAIPGVPLSGGVRVLIAAKPVDFRNYAECMIMLSLRWGTRGRRDRTMILTQHNFFAPVAAFSIATSLSEARKRPRCSDSGATAASASSFSVGSARR